MQKHNYSPAATSSQCETAVLYIIIIGINNTRVPPVRSHLLAGHRHHDQNAQEYVDDHRQDHQDNRNLLAHLLTGHHHHDHNAQDHQDEKNLLAHLLAGLSQQPLTCLQLLQLPLQVVVHLLIILIKTLSIKIIMMIIIIQLLQLPLQVVVHNVSRFQWQHQHHHLILINYKHRPSLHIIFN